MGQAKLLHKRIEHLNVRDVANTMDKVSQASDFCDTCALGQTSKKPDPKVSNKKTTKKQERVCSDVIGLGRSSSIEGNRYAISFIYGSSGYTVVKFMKHKTQALQAFKEYVTHYSTYEIFLKQRNSS